MGASFSPVVKAVEAIQSGNFSVKQLDLARLGSFVAPVMMFDHYRMSGPTFAPHPHAGLSAVSYIFEDSAGAMHNRDSLGHSVDIKPGEIVWTQAGVVHDEYPAKNGATVHGLQLFVNLSSKNKFIPPQMLYGRSSAIPIWKDTAGNRVRILSGELGELHAPIEPAEPFDFLTPNYKAVGHTSQKSAGA